MAYKLTWEDRMVTFEYSGEMSSGDVIASNREVYGDARFDDLRWQLVFMDEVESVSFSEEDVKVIAFMDRAAARTNGRIVVAFVGESSLLRDLHDRYSKYVKEDLWPVCRFDSRGEAVDYISGLRAETVG